MEKIKGGTQFSDGAVLLYRRTVGKVVAALIEEMQGSFFRHVLNHIRASNPKSIVEHQEKVCKVSAHLNELMAKYPMAYSTPLYQFEVLAMQNIDLAIDMLYRLRATIEDGTMLQRVAVEEKEIPDTANAIIDRIKSLMQ
jgi:hypothetical protein